MNPHSRLLNFLLGHQMPHNCSSCGHPESDGIPSLADGLPLENQWGAVHVLKNITPEDEEGMWGHEAKESAAEEKAEYR